METVSPNQGILEGENPRAALKLEIEGMHCAGCVSSVEKALNGLVGVETGSTTSADVGTGAEATTLLRWDKKSLKNYLEHHETLKHTFDLILTADLIFKLRSMDQQQDVTHSQI